jgi:hypothetical protein
VQGGQSDGRICPQKKENFFADGEMMRVREIKGFAQRWMLE